MTTIPAGDEIPLADAPSTFRSDWLPIGLAVLAFSGLSIWAAIASEGFLEADSITHYLYARFALDQTHYLVNIWGRPLVTGLYALPAYFGEGAGVRITSLVLALVCGFVAYAIARKQQYRWPVLALIFTLAQPLVFLHSFSELTELPFAALIGVAFLAYVSRQLLLMTILIALSPLARPEGFGFILLVVVALIAHRRWWQIPILAVPILLWNYCGWRIYGSPDYSASLPRAMQWVLWLKHEWPYAPESLYPSGSILHFVGLLPAIVSPLIFPATVIGIWRCARDRRFDERLIAIVPLLILVGHSVLFATGKMASSGEMRYMLVVAPFWGLLGASGFAWVFDRLKWRWPIIVAAAIAVFPALLNQRAHVGGIPLGYQVLPLPLYEDMIIARRFARWYNIWPLHDEYPRVAASHPVVYYGLDISPNDPNRAAEWAQKAITTAAPGTILLWDPTYGLLNSDSKRTVTEESLEEAGWVYEPDISELINNEETADDRRFSVWLSPAMKSGVPSASR